jgi:B9 domain-containing protein 2
MAVVNDQKSSVTEEPEVHIIGQLVGGSGFTSDNALCAYTFHCGDTWECVEGEEQGQTQVDYPADGGTATWNHPIDLHYYAKTQQGWPYVVLEVYRLDEVGRNEVGMSVCLSVCREL